MYLPSTWGFSGYTLTFLVASTCSFGLLVLFTLVNLICTAFFFLEILHNSWFLDGTLSSFPGINENFPSFQWCSGEVDKFVQTAIFRQSLRVFFKVPREKVVFILLYCVQRKSLRFYIFPGVMAVVGGMYQDCICGLL